ncbi:MAG: hypothetical protein WAW09_08580 [Smithella sp.]
MEEKLIDIKNSLFHIHALSHVLIGIYTDLMSCNEINKSGNLSIQRTCLFSISEMITEKTDACLGIVENIESKLNERK